MKNLKLYHDKNRYFDIFNGNIVLETKKSHIKNVLYFTEKIFDILKDDNVNKELLMLCAEHHDDGRVNQYELLGKFWDNNVSHNVLGLERIDRFLEFNDDIDKVSENIQIFKDVILYHGKENLCYNEFSKPYINIVTAADNLENATACVSYLVREIESDAKGYIQKNPNANQKEVSEYVFNHFLNGEKFDKVKYCHTYAEYVLFAATLMTNCIKKYDFAKQLLLQPGYGYNTILEGYKEVFDYALDENLAQEAYKVLVKYSK